MAVDHNGAPRLPAVPAYSHQSHHPPRQPQSPSAVQQPSPVTQPSPSTVEASPRQTPGPLIANGNAAYGTVPVEQPRMRASVACDRCRKSKTKCENTGINSVCKSCSNARQTQTCVYTQNSVSSTSVSGRRESTADGEGPPKKRRKNIVPTTAGPTVLKDVSGTADNPLDSSLLTAEVWQELFDIYEKHFAFDFPFFHRRTFLRTVQQYYVSQVDTGEASNSSIPKSCYPPLLLAFLTWTARHHPKLVEHNGNDPIATAQFYAEATTKSMGVNYLSDFTLEKIQALLLLGFHEWIFLEGEKGWMRLGNATRAAQLLHLSVDERRNSAISGLSEKEMFIQSEKQRRTFWCCFLMDRYMSLGLRRPGMINSQDIQIQLICSDNAFRDGRGVRTRLLGETNEDYQIRRSKSHLLPQLKEQDPRQSSQLSQHHQFDPLGSPSIKWEVGETEHEFVWYMPIVDLFTEITKWSLNTGRRQEGLIPPWDKRTRFKQLDDRLHELKRNLPHHLQLTPGNTEDRAWGRPEKYSHIHAMYTLCTIFLYREYLPAAPWGQACPDGPIDEPKLEAKPIDAKPSQPHYWINQAKAFCKAARDFSDLLEAIQVGQSSKVIASPIVSFAAYTVGCSLIYCQFFPNYDPDRVASMPKSHITVVQYLATAVKRFKLPYSWLKQMADWRDYYSEKRTEYKQLAGVVGDSPCSSSSDGSRSGGLRDYIAYFEMPHKQFGTTDKDQPWHPEELKTILASLGCYEKDTDGTGTSRSMSVKHEKREENDGHANHDMFAAHSGFTSVNSPAKYDQAHPENQHMFAHARPTSRDYSSTSPHYSTVLPHHEQFAANSAGKPQSHVATDLRLDGSYLPRMHAPDPTLNQQSLKSDLRHVPPPLSESQRAAKRDRIEKEGAPSLGQLMSFGPIQFIDGKTYWNGNPY